MKQPEITQAESLRRLKKISEDLNATARRFIGAIAQIQREIDLLTKKLQSDDPCLPINSDLTK